MIRIDWKTLDSIGQEYVDRLFDCAKKHPNTFLNKKIINRIDPKEFRELILCPPSRLDSYSCPPTLNADDLYHEYDLYFGAEGDDHENNAIWLTSKMNIKVCPYCNRIYTFTIKGKKGVRPELDHFFPRSKNRYKHLALSFYNLIPSCPSCNHRKAAEIFDFHPFFGPLTRGGQQPLIQVASSKVKYDANGKPILFPEKPEIKIDNANHITNHLALDELYKHHSDYAKEILDKILAYNAAYYDPLIKEFQGMGRTPEEIERLIWGNYVDDAHQANRPLSKMTRDILEQFGIL